MATLAELRDRFFAAGVGTGGPFDGDSSLQPIIDGVDYFKAISDSIEKTSGSNDFVYLVTWELDLDWDLAHVDAPVKTLGDLLVEKAASGVDVRVIVNGGLAAVGLYPLMPLFANNLAAVRRLRAARRPGDSAAPLANRVLFDWTGANLTGSHHQKATVVRSSQELVAYVGGMNMVPTHRDRAPHAQKIYPDGSPWGWHDIGSRVLGEAAAAVWQNFNARWLEAATLPEAGKVEVEPYFAGEWRTRLVVLPVNPSQTTLPSSQLLSDPNATQATNQGLRVLRSRYAFKEPDRRTLGTTGQPWISEPTNTPLTEIYQTYRRAIAAARRYIYIEDQFLEDQLHVEPVPDDFSLYPALAAAVAANPSLKLILVGSGRADPGDPPFLRGADGRKNVTLTHGIETLLLDNVPAPQKHNVAVWRVENTTVHSKLLLIDDRFVAIGSANFQSRSMYGVDSELQVAMVTPDTTIEDFRVALWSEHLRVDVATAPEASAALHDLDRALGLWREGWYSPDPTLWFLSGNPAGVNGHGVLSFVGPEA